MRLMTDLFVTLRTVDASAAIHKFAKVLDYLFYFILHVRTVLYVNVNNEKFRIQI